MATYNPMQQFVGAPPEIEQGAMDLFQRQQLAQMLMQRGLEPAGDTQYTHSGGGQWAAPPQAIKQGWGQGLAKLGQVAAGAYMNKQAGEEQKALAQQLRTQNQAETSAIMDANSGTPAQPMGPPTEDGQMGMREAIAPNRDMATALMMGSTNPDWKAVGKHRLMETPKQDNLVVAPNSSVFGPDGKLRFTAPPAPEKPQYESATPLQKLISERAALVTANPNDPNIKIYDNAIRKESETARQISPVIKMGGDSKYTNVQEDGKGGFIGQDKNGVMQQIPVAEGVTGKGSTLSILGGREGTQVQRVMMAANQVANDAENIARGPLTSSRGLFGGRSQEKSLFEAGKESLANTMTTQEVQTYNVRIAGIQRNLAAIEAAGLMPSGALTHQMEAVVAKEGDTNLTKMQKLAQIRQIVDAGLETLASNPRVSEEQKKHMTKVGEKISNAIPYTHADIDAMTAAQQANPNVSVKDVIKAKTPVATTPKGIPEGSKIIGKTPDGKDVYQSSDGKKWVE